MSRNFELMQQAGKEVGRSPVDVSVRLAEQPSPRLEAPTPATESGVSDWLMGLEVLRKHWRFSATFALAVMLTVATVTFLTTPTYEAKSRVEIDPPGEVFSLDGNSASASDAEYLETESQVLQTDSLAVDVIRSLHLEQNPEFVGKVKAGDNPARVASASDALQLTLAERMALASFKARLKVKRDTASRLIDITFSSHDPALAAQVTNTMVRTFIQDTFQTRHNAIMKSSEWLSRQLDDIRVKMEDSSRALAEYQGSIGIADVDGDKSTYSEHMSELSRQYTAAESERIQIQALLKNMQGGNPDSLPDVRTSPVVQQLSQKLAELRAELAQALVVYGPNHPVAKKLQSQVDEMQSQLNTQKTGIVNSVRASYAAAEARERLMAAEMKGTTKEMGQVSRLAALKKEVQTEVDLYNSLYAKIKEAGIAAASKSANIRVIDEARTPDVPTSPRTVLNLCVGLLGALLGGVALAFICEELDNKLRSPEDIRRWIGNSNVSVIPVIGESDRQEASLPWPKRMVGLLPSAGAEELQTNTFFLERPNSPEGEAVQALYGSIMLSWPGHPPQALLIASSFPGEGKTTVALNLSYALAKQGRTCLVDADLRKGRLARAFQLTTDKGLGDVLGQGMPLDAALLDVPGLSNLSILPAGTLRGNAGQLICSETMQQVLQKLRQRYRFVVIDSAPILPFVDGRALSTLADAVILVGRSGITTRQAMKRSVELLNEIHGAPILQVVLNAAEQDATDYKHYGYAYGEYTTR